MANFSLRMRHTYVILLPVWNLLADSDSATSISCNSVEISAIRQQFWVICDQFSTAHVGLHFVLLPVIILMWESDSVTPISYKSVKILAIRECYRPFFATFSVRMRHSAVILLPVWNTTEWHRFTIKVVKLFQYDINLGSFSANFELRMWDCAIFLLPLIILMSDFDSATPIS